MLFLKQLLVEPEVKLGEYKNLEGEEIDTEVTDEEVDRKSITF